MRQLRGVRRYTSKVALHLLSLRPLEDKDRHNLPGYRSPWNPDRNCCSPATAFVPRNIPNPKHWEGFSGKQRELKAHWLCHLWVTAQHRGCGASCSHSWVKSLDSNTLQLDGVRYSADSWRFLESKELSFCTHWPPLALVGDNRIMYNIPSLYVLQAWAINKDSCSAHFSFKTVLIAAKRRNKTLHPKSSPIFPTKKLNFVITLLKKWLHLGIPRRYHSSTPSTPCFK